MPAASTEARRELADALTAAGITTYAYRPPTVVLPAAWIEAGDPWLVPTRIGSTFAGELRLTLTGAVQLVDQSASLDQLEELVDELLAAMPKGWRVVEVSGADVEQLGAQGEQLAASLTVTASITNE